MGDLLTEAFLMGVLWTVFVLFGAIYLIVWAQKRVIKESLYYPDEFKARQLEYERKLKE